MSIPASIAILGAGPRGVGILERIAMNFVNSESRLVVHLVDPHPVGAGRIWRLDQSPLLRLNSMAGDVTMFTDETSTIDGPISRGPSLIEWAELVRTGRITDVAIDDDIVAAELRGLVVASFPTRRLHSFYLDWFYRRARSALPASVTVVEHESIATAVHDGDRQRVDLANGNVIDADVVIYALGHIDSKPREEHRDLRQFAERNELLYVPPAFTADADTTAIEPGDDVIVRGMGLASVDLVVLLTEGRGGRFRAAEGGGLDYLPSGLEPKLHLGSRRGVPYHSKISSTLQAPPAARRFFTSETAAALERSHDTIGFIDDAWPLIAKELLWGYYHELFVGHPDRVASTWAEFSPAIVRSAWNSEQLRADVAAAVPDARDRLDLEQLDRPLAGLRFDSAAELQAHVRSYIEDDLVARSSPRDSATLALFSALLYSMFDLGGIIDSPKWTPRSRAEELTKWWLNYFSFIASGPPAHRLEELLALSRAGVVDFLGAGLRVEADAASGTFIATSASLDGAVAARILIEARLPETDVATTDNPLLRSLLDSGAGSEELVADASYSGSTGRIRVDRASRPLGADGTPHPARFAVGANTSAPFVGAFARPRTNAVSFRENDRVARAALETVGISMAAATAALT